MSIKIKKGSTIALDLDGVMADLVTGFLSYHNLHFKTTLRSEDITAFHFDKVIGCSKEEINNRILNFYQSSSFDRLMPVVGVIPATQALKQLSNLIAITARPPLLEDKTKTWLEKHFPNTISEVYFANNYFTDKGADKSKRELCLELGVELIVEDSAEFANSCAEYGVRVMLLNYPWNKNIQVKEGVKRVDSWQEVISQLKFE